MDHLTSFMYLGKSSSGILASWASESGALDLVKTKKLIKKVEIKINDIIIMLPVKIDFHVILISQFPLSPKHYCVLFMIIMNTIRVRKLKINLGWNR